MNRKGQAFSTFQLLISAIIAVTILVILLGILGLLPPIDGGEPHEKIAELLNSKCTSKLCHETSNSTITFKPESAPVTAHAIAENATNLGLTTSQICVSTGAFMPETEIVGPGESGSDSSKPWKLASDGSKLWHVGGKISVRFTVICDSTALNLRDYIASISQNVKPEWLENPSIGFKCKCLEDEYYQQQKCCLILLQFGK